MASSSNTKLTISIPSYNRNLVLKKNLEVLLEQYNDEIEILIIDNFSDIPVEDTLELELKKYQNLKVIRNRENIGLSANIIRCFEYSKTKWAWLLSDDDVPVVNAIKIVLDLITKNEDATYINFSSNYTKNRAHSFQSVGSNDCIEKVESIHSLFLISLGVYQISNILPFLRFAYLYSYSLVPHFVLLMLSLNNSGKVLFSNCMILENQGDSDDPNNKWSFLPLTLGLPTILELPLGFSYSTTKKVSNFIYSSVINRPILSLERTLQLYKRENIDVLRYNYVQPYKRMKLKMPFSWRFEFLIGNLILSNQFFIKFYLILMNKVRTVLKKRINTVLNERYNRV